MIREMSAGAGPLKGRRPRLLRHIPERTSLLRQIALHEETAALLEARAKQLGSAAEGRLFRKRADEHRDQARRLRYKLTR
jgi:hypothetical protein